MLFIYIEHSQVSLNQALCTMKVHNYRPTLNNFILATA